MSGLLELKSKGLYCPSGGFYIDPWLPVDLAVITHGHSDHARAGSRKYFSSRTAEPILRRRLGEKIDLKALPYGETLKVGEVKVSLHPAGHVLGSAQVRVEKDGEVWVVSGDYKRSKDRSCEPFEVVKCDTFISEATFGLPVYAWPTTHDVVRDIHQWWQEYSDGPSLLFAYAFGKTQRILAELTQFTDRCVYLHGACHSITEIYRAAGVKMVPTELVRDQEKGRKFNGELILAPPSAHRSTWMKRFKSPQTAFASGWMQIRGHRRRRGYERGFVLSDHADWKELLQTIQETQARRILLTHGQSDPLRKYLQEEFGVNCETLTTQFEGEADA